MHIKTIQIRHFRLLKNSTLELNNEKRQELSLLIGKNNSGKTSFIVLFDKFFRFESYKFDYNDFSLCLRKEMKEIKADTDLSSCSIQMKMEIVYSKDDNLEHLSDFILDLDPKENVVKLLFECTIDKQRLFLDLSEIEQRHKQKYVEKNLTEYLVNKYYAYSDEKDLEAGNRHKLVEKSISDIRKVFNYQVIHAKRNVSSSEHSGNGKTALSELASSYFNKDNLFSKEEFGKINETILEMDDALNTTYEKHFEGYLNTVKQFMDGGKLNVVSNLESKRILSNYSKIVYGNTDTFLPETLTGLGHLNILFLLLQLEVKKKFFEQEKRDINLLFIEEPEAHTHPQMQYIFAKRIKEVLKTLPNVQTFITSHSSHIVSQCEFEDLRYFKNSVDNVLIKNFHKELSKRYDEEPEHFKFLKQYLTIDSSELFFAEKIIFVEGVSERLLLPLFIKQYDETRKAEVDYIPLTSQNISYVEVGANSKVFRHFIEFLDIDTLIITDIDSTSYDEGSKRWKACCTDDATNTSNESIKYYLKAPEKDHADFAGWLEKLKQNSCEAISKKIQLSYQVKENTYHGRSFEDTFISINLKLIATLKADILGLKNVAEISESRTDYYPLTEQILDKKSDFASSILYLALTKDVKWKIPEYIIDGLKWIAK